MPESIHQVSSLTRADFATAFLIREVEQKLLEMFAAGKLFGTVHTCIGQEWSGVAVARALRDGDLIFSNHRCHGHFLARTGNVNGLIAEIMGKQSGVCGGRGGSQHLCDRERGFFSNGVQGGIVPVAAGLALSLEFKRSQNIAVVFIGDGTLGEGAVYEALNIAAKWSLPLLIVLENNRYAQSTSQHQTLAGSIEARAAAFGIETLHSNTWNPEQLVAAAQQCIQTVREERRPVFLQVDTDRLMAHSKGDDDRPSHEIQAGWQRDALKLFQDESPAESQALRHEAEVQVDEAVANAERAPFAHFTAPVAEFSGETACNWRTAAEPQKDRVGAGIRNALARNMRRDERIILLGEDIESPYGGAFKITRGLSTEFPERVRNTPISEGLIVGLGSGLALAGFLPVCEIMFGDFLTLSADQWINHAAKFHYMYNEQVTVPLIVRTAMGGRRGYGPTHSQTLDKHFLGVPQTRVLAVNGRYDAGLVYDELFASNDRPTLVVENKLLYTMQQDAPIPEGFVLEHNDEAFPCVRMRPLGRPQVTVFCYGGMMQPVEQAVAGAFDEFEILAEVICPTQLYPLNPWPVIESLKQTHRLLIAEEGQSFASVGSELVAQISELAPGVLRNVKRVGPPQTPIASSGPMESEMLPGVSVIVAALSEVCSHG
jgi:2-oxoisovalerate dehydrogenase E1 component